MTNIYCWRRGIILAEILNIMLHGRAEIYTKYKTYKNFFITKRHLSKGAHPPNSWNCPHSAVKQSGILHLLQSQQSNNQVDKEVHSALTHTGKSICHLENRLPEDVKGSDEL